MSYAIWVIEYPGQEEPYSWSYTQNCAEMWRVAGADLAAFHQRLAAECEPLLREAIKKLRRWPSFFRSMNPKNGWGSYDTLIPMLESLANAMRDAPQATVRVWR